MAIDLSQYVRVTNTHKEEILSRFDGEDYKFKPNEPEDIHVAAAAHMFGFGQKDKSAALARLGMLKMSSDIPNAMQWLQGIHFEAVPNLPGTAPAPSEAAGPPGASGGGNPSGSGDTDSGAELPSESTYKRRR